MERPTPFPDVNAVLQRLLAGVQAALGDRFVGLYLYGSLATGGFDPDRSDVDFVVVTEGELPEPAFHALQAMHARLASDAGRWAGRLEGAYLPRAALRRYDPADPPRPTLNEGRFTLDRQGSDWVIQRRVLREHGVVLAGPPLRTLIDPVSFDEIRRAVQDVLRGWWAPMLYDPARLARRNYQAYAVLTMARARYTLEKGTLVSKTAAARWAMNELNGKWRALIEQALAWPHGPQPDRLQETQAFIAHTLEACLVDDAADPLPPE